MEISAHILALRTYLRKLGKPKGVSLESAFSRWAMAQATRGNLAPRYDPLTPEAQALRREIDVLLPGLDLAPFAGLSKTVKRHRVPLEPDAVGCSFDTEKQLVAVTAPGLPVFHLGAASYADLMARYRGARETFWHALYLMLARYHALGGQWHHFRCTSTLVAECDVELFASPLNCRAPRYASLYPDTDVPFGSMGNALTALGQLLPTDRVLVHPPMSELYQGLLLRAMPLPVQEALYILPLWEDTPLFRRLDAATRVGLESRRYTVAEMVDTRGRTHQGCWGLFHIVQDS